MVPVDFKGSNTIYAKNQPEYLPLPAFVDETGVAVTCWRLTWWERLMLLVTGRIWLMQHTFNQPLQPQCPVVARPLEYIDNGETNGSKSVSEQRDSFDDRGDERRM